MALRPLAKPHDRRHTGQRVMAPEKSTPPERTDESGVSQRLCPELEGLLRASTELELRELVESGAIDAWLCDAEDD